MKTLGIDKFFMILLCISIFFLMGLSVGYFIHGFWIQGSIHTLAWCVLLYIKARLGRQL